MFWRFGGYANISTIDSLLEKPDVTVEELLDEADLIQELKSQNSKLLEFLRDENVLDRLMQYVILPKAPQDDFAQQSEPEPEADDDGNTSNPLNSLFGKAKRRSRSKSIREQDEESKEEKQRQKYGYVACEVLASDVWSISEAVLENRDSLRRFWHYLKRPAPLDGAQAGYFTKVNETLFDKKTDEMLEFFKSVDNVVADMLRHVDCPVIMDLLLKIISLERCEGGQGTIDWLQTQNIIPLLLANLSSEHESSTQTSAGDFIKAIITISANATAQDSNVIGPNELTRQLVSEECVTMLIKDMLQGGNPLTVGVGIVIEVIRKNNSDYDLENQIGPVPKSSDPIYLGTLLRQFGHHIPDFMNLIKSKDAGAKELKVAFGTKIEPLGFDRFKTCELMAELLHCSNMILLNQRGCEAEVQARDLERNRLKAEGKLTAFNEEPSGHEYGTSVDSSGFHHARAPSFSEAADIKKLGVSNSTEEDFETVSSADVKDDFDEKDQATTPTLPDAPAALAPDSDSNKQDPPTDSDAASDDLQRQLNALTVSVGDQNSSASSEKANVDLSPHADDKPAPLFFGKPRQQESNTDTDDHDTTTIEDASVTDSDQSPQYQVDVDGKPVVGDFLKMVFVEHRVVPTILDFFFRFPWNNFLHNVVYDVVQQVFNGQMERGYNRSLAIDLFDTGRITDRIIEGQAASDKSQVETKRRLGYMGHLTLIAEEVVKFTERIPPETLSQLVLDKVTSKDWVEYVETTLTETRERDNAILGGVRPDANLGPRQAVLNAVQAAQGFGQLNSLSSLTNNATIGLDTAAQTEEDSGSRSSGYLFSASSISGFNHGSSDEEDDDLDDGDRRRASDVIDESDNANDNQDDSNGPSIPPPLNPTRARGKFAARMAQRRLEQAAAAAAVVPSGHDDDSCPEDIEDVERLVDMNADEDEDDDEDEEEVARTIGADADQFFGSDDSVEGGEEVGIVMRKYDRGWTGAPVAPRPPSSGGAKAQDKEARVD